MEDWIDYLNAGKEFRIEHLVHSKDDAGPNPRKTMIVMPRMQRRRRGGTEEIYAASLAEETPFKSASKALRRHKNNNPCLLLQFTRHGVVTRICGRQFKRLELGRQEIEHPYQSKWPSSIKHYLPIIAVLASKSNAQRHYLPLPRLDLRYRTVNDKPAQAPFSKKPDEANADYYAATRSAPSKTKIPYASRRGSVKHSSASKSGRTSSPAETLRTPYLSSP